jgi:HEAT repeat protein
MWDVLSFLALFGGGSLFLRSLRGRPGNPKTPGDQAWRNALAPYGTPVEDASSAQARISTGEDSLHIQVKPAQHGPDLVTIFFPEPLELAGVEIRKAVYGRQVHDPESGDSQFESRFWISGPGRLVSALLDAETRRLMISLGSGRLKISDGQVRAEMAVEQAPRLLPLLLDIAKRLARPLGVAERLAENVLNDPITEVRLRNLVLLLREAPRDPKTVATLRVACADQNTWIRLRAAGALGAEGHAVLAELTESEQDAVSEEAVLLLGRNLTLQRTREILAQAVDQHHHRTARACLEPISLGGNAEDVEMLANVMAVQDGELAAAAAQALKTLGSPAAEPSLILALQRKQEDLQVAAAIALGRLGSAAAVLPLKEAAASARRSALRKAAREAVAEIQSRLLGATPGQLSLSGTDAGNLSLAQAEGGELSLATDPTGRLSLGGGKEEG